MRGEWLRRPSSPAAVVFVHGVLSSGDSAWTNANGANWPSMVAEEPELASLGVYVYTYQSDIFSGTYALGDIVDDFKERAKLDALLAVRELIFVCHSMGGIVVRKLLVERSRDFIDRRIGIGLFLVASPSLGSAYGNLVDRLAAAMNHAQGLALSFARDNPWLGELDKQFQNLREAGTLRIRGKELVEDKFVIARKFVWFRQVVESFSGARYFGEAYKVPSSDHFTIAKPANRGAIQHRLLVQFISETVAAPGSEPAHVADETVGAIDVAAPVRAVDADDVAAPAAPDTAETLDVLVARYPLLAAAYREIGSTGIAFATQGAILVSSIPKALVASFWLQMAKVAEAEKLYPIAVCALELVDRCGVGHDVVEFVLADGRLPEQDRQWIGMRMKDVRDTDALIWCHHQLTTTIRSDAYYQSFVQRHFEAIAEPCRDEMSAYLLSPDRGPADFNIDTFFTLVKRLDDPEPFVIRWMDWIRAGRFDGRHQDGDETARLLYVVFNDIEDDVRGRFEPIVTFAHQRIYLLLKSSGTDVDKGLYHLRGMMDAAYRGLADVIVSVLPRVYADRFTERQAKLFMRLRAALPALLRSMGDPENEALAESYREARQTIEADGDGDDD